MVAHWLRLGEILGKPLVQLTRPNADGSVMTLDSLIEFFDALPNNRQRWCTRMLKIEPMIAFLKESPAIQYVGLRADEEERKGIYSEEAVSDFPLRRWGWGLPEVVSYLEGRRIRIPKRTDCLKCYDQRLYEWRDFYENYFHLWVEAEAQEAKTGATFRSPSRDSYPAELRLLAQEFERRRTLKGDSRRQQKELFAADSELEATSCRVCRL